MLVVFENADSETELAVNLDHVIKVESTDNDPSWTIIHLSNGEQVNVKGTFRAAIAKLSPTKRSARKKK